MAPARVHWSVDGWQTTHDIPTRDTGLGIHLVDLDTAKLAKDATVVFTFYWLDDQRWENVDYTVAIE
jgi:glucoamylase